MFSGFRSSVHLCICPSIRLKVELIRLDLVVIDQRSRSLLSHAFLASVTGTSCPYHSCECDKSGIPEWNFSMAQTSVWTKGWTD